MWDEILGLFLGRKLLVLWFRNDYILKMNWFLMNVGSFCLERKVEGFS